MKNEEQQQEHIIKDWCVECDKEAEKHSKINGLCIDCAKKLFRK